MVPGMTTYLLQPFPGIAHYISNPDIYSIVKSYCPGAKIYKKYFWVKRQITYSELPSDILEYLMGVETDEKILCDIYLVLKCDLQFIYKTCLDKPKLLSLVLEHGVQGKFVNISLLNKYLFLIKSEACKKLIHDYLRKIS